MQDFAVELAEIVSTFEFVRDVNALGLTIGIETDLPSSDIVQAARQRGMRLESAGDHSIRIQPPPVIGEDERNALLQSLAATMEALQRDTAEISL